MLPVQKTLKKLEAALLRLCSGRAALYTSVDTAASVCCAHCLSDVQKAKKLLNDLDACGVNADQTKPGEPAFAMTEAYYRQLALSEDERQREAYRQREEARKKRAA